MMGHESIKGVDGKVLQRRLIHIEYFWNLFQAQEIEYGTHSNWPEPKARDCVKQYQLQGASGRTKKLFKRC